MRAVWFIRKFELVLKCNKMKINSPKTRTAQAAAKRYRQGQMKITDNKLKV